MATEMMKTISIRMPEPYVLEFEEACKREFADRGVKMPELDGNELREYLIKKVLESYSEGKISLWEASKIIGMTCRGVFVELKKRNIPFRYEDDELEINMDFTGLKV